MNVLTALTNPLIQRKIGELYPDINFVLDDLTYKDGVLEALKIHKLDAIITSTNIEGKYDKYEYINQIRQLDDTVKIILILKEEDKDYTNWLASKGVFDVLIEGKTDFQELYEALKREQKVIYKTQVITETKTEYIEQEKIIKVKEPVLQERIIGTVTIAVYGSCRGAGCTQTAIDIANFISRLKDNNKVAIVEINKTGDFKRLADVKCSTDKMPFKYKDIDFYYETRVADIINLKIYNYIIMDFGVIYEIDSTGEFVYDREDIREPIIGRTAIEEFHRANLKICTCQTKPWQLEETMIALGFGAHSDVWEPISNQTTFIFINAESEDEKAFRDSAYDKSIYFAPYVSAPFEEVEDMDEVIKNVISLVLPKSYELGKANLIKKVGMKILSVLKVIILAILVIGVIYWTTWYAGFDILTGIKKILIK